MEAVYHWVGVAVVWGVGGPTSVFALWMAAWYAWRARPRTIFERRVNSAFTWARVFLLGKRWRFSLEGAQLIMSANHRKPRLYTWERDIIAFMVRYNRRIGWKQRN